MQSYLDWTPGGAQVHGVADDRRTATVRAWRRRVLLRRGARMHAAMGVDVENRSLAMLDEAGVVVAWYGPARGRDCAAEHIVDRHVSQFYIPEEIASKQPLRDLHCATVERSNTRQGWRRGADGTTYWGTTVIEAVVLRDGRLQGFSYVTSPSEGPLANVPVTRSLSSPQCETDEGSSGGALALNFPSVRDRTIRSCGGANRQ
jgi:hypothetical protein